MGRMINTDAAYAVLTDYYHHTTDTQHAALREALGRVESVDAEPVVHGRWVTDGMMMDCGEYLMTRCTACGTPFEYGYDMPYCPQCGAKMDERGNDSETD